MESILKLRNQTSQQRTLKHVNNVLEILVFDELDYDVFLRLNLQHLENEAEEGGWLDVSRVGAADVPQLHGLIDQQFGWKSSNYFI